jgi:SAM-dependent methyltransferase
MKTIFDNIKKIVKQLIVRCSVLAIVYRCIRYICIAPSRLNKLLCSRFLYYRDLRTFRRQEQSTTSRFIFGKKLPCLKERFTSNGVAKGHYFHQDLLVARRIHFNNPFMHIDAGSRVDGFVAHVAAFRQLKVIDVRPIASKIPNVEFIQADLMGKLRDDLLCSCDSLSCLHALEHFGLGRYGEPVQYDGDILGLNNLFRILKPQGKFYISLPIGPQRIEFNAHRVFSLSYLVA